MSDEKSEKQVIDDLEFNTLPNHLTVFRMAMVPILVFILYYNIPNANFFAALIFVIASITDFLDGYIARSQKLITIYGKLLDPLADKFLVVSTLIMLLHLGRVEAYIIVLLVCRELAITGLRALASAEGVVISASSGGKWKTGTQMVAIPLLVWNTNFLGLPLITAGHVLLYASLVMSLWSAKEYIFAFFKALKEQRKLRKLKKKLKKKGLNV